MTNINFERLQEELIWNKVCPFSFSGFFGVSVVLRNADLSILDAFQISPIIYSHLITWDTEPILMKNFGFQLC